MDNALNSINPINSSNNPLNYMEEILSHQICGFHQYVLTPPVHLNYASCNLCELLGVEESELLDNSTDLYLQRVHPADREKYSAFIQQIILKEQALTDEYRLVKKDGTIIHVRDTVTPGKLDDGTLIGHSVLADITDLKSENDNLRFLNDTIPCGFIRYTCEKQPKITYINPKMIELLRFPEVKDGEMDYLEMYKSNIFLMVPMEERRRFSKYLNRVFSADAPIAGDMTLLRCDGTRAHVFGWVTKTINEQGEAEFQSVCMDITERYKARKTSESKRYLRALTDVYDKIFEFNLDANTVKCLHCEEASFFKRFENVEMQIEDALIKWLVDSVASEDQDSVRRFFVDFCQKRLRSIDGKPPQITYKARSTDDTVKQYSGVFIKADESINFYCCREIKETANSMALKKENDQLREKMRDLVTQFSDGIAAFEISPKGLVKPLYATENVCAFFGYTEEEWLPLTERFTPIETFVAYSEVAYENFAELLRTGEAEFNYFDYQSQSERRIKAICSEKEPNADSSRYVMLYPVEGSSGTGSEASRAALPETRTVSIRTFGYFDVFVGDTPIAFRNKKSKELFALLVDRKGGYVTSEEAISFLWEDEPANTLTLSRYRKVALRLKSTLEEYGIPDIVEAVDGKRRIVMDKVDCDLYNYLSGKEEYSQLFKGSYLTNYSWGENTLGELLGDRE
ncbi:MAG: PAS domain-containing protein [Lachnospiraceae bacterium]|nr:PAS domain-containing protein [Lachnospiraceae bacterium]